MSKRVYVGNLNFITNEEMLKSVFEKYGSLLSVEIIYDKDTSQSKGFAFIEFDNENCADDAIFALNGKEVDGRKIRVSAAEEKKPVRNNNAGSYRKGNRR